MFYVTDIAKQSDMKILLIGEYSNLHWTLSEALRQLGHEVTVVSDGCGWMDNRRDIDLSLKDSTLKSRLAYRARLLEILSRLRGYDVVQVISPVFLRMGLSEVRRVFKYIKRNNGSIFLGAFGTDYYYTKTCLEGAFRYSDFGAPRNGVFESLEDNTLWNESPLKEHNIYIAEECNGIIACLYEYYRSYSPVFGEKAAYVPLPINTDAITPSAVYDGKVRFFIGIQKHKARLKGSDIMLEALRKVADAYPATTELHVAESVPYHEYSRMMRGCNLLIDQLYSYTPGMNALQGMASGMAVAGGGEEEMYALLGETENKPVINVVPDNDELFRIFTDIARHPETLQERGNASRLFVEKHHDYKKVAEKYLAFWNSKI